MNEKKKDVELKDAIYVVTHSEDKGKICKILKMDNSAPRFRECQIGLLSGEIKTVKYTNLMLVSELLEEESILLEKLARINKIKGTHEPLCLLK